MSIPPRDGKLLPKLKLPGKTEFSGRRRAVTRKSGHHSHPDATGGEFRPEKVPAFKVKAGEILRLTFTTVAYPANERAFVAFGGWFSADVDLDIKVDGAWGRYTLAVNRLPDWGKVGGMWPASGRPLEVAVEITAEQDGNISFSGVECGLVEHEFLTEAPPALLHNMFATSPESHFYTDSGRVVVERVSGELLRATTTFVLPRKSCNRCARFLPINLGNERATLSFSNHCVARRPCKHPGFGRLTDVQTGEAFQLEYGYQLECRFCKKFTVNAAHNKQRTPAQMKEDGARRRAIEMLLTELFGESSQLRYRHLTGGRELAHDVWEKFGKKCFKCSTELPTAKDMHLDHTRPLALLWPLDGSATALCKNCNSKKRDRPPGEFYSDDEIERLAAITKVSVAELIDPSPNMAAIAKLKVRMDWFFDTFLRKEALTKVRDGKTAGELLVKALQKAINKLPAQNRFDLKAQLVKRRDALD